MFYWRSTEISEKRIRVNEQIRISPVRLIQDDGEQIGIVSMDEARERAAERGMDLVEVAPEARPPVVKMMDYGKQHTTLVLFIAFKLQSMILLGGETRH